MLLTISVTVIAAGMLVTVIFLIPVLLQVRRTAREAEKLMQSVRADVVPLSRDLARVAEQSDNLLILLRRQMESIEESLSAVRDSAVRFRMFQENVLRRVEPSLFLLGKTVGGVSQGISAFVRTLLR
jgi:uncharacterized protein YoxC